MANDIFIYRSTGQPLGFIRNGILYSSYGQYLGWQDGQHIWAINGHYAGTLSIFGQGHHYIVRYMFGAAPIPQVPRISLNLPPQELPALPAIIPAVALPVGYKDGI